MHVTAVPEAPPPEQAPREREGERATARRRRPDLADAPRSQGGRPSLCARLGRTEAPREREGDGRSTAGAGAAAGRPASARGDVTAAALLSGADGRHESARGLRTMKVYIIGAGPGDPGLLTVRGAELIARCPIVLYTGSLVPRAVLASARPDAELLDSSSMTLDEIVSVFARARDRGLDVARVHTGDPSLFGSTGEQMRALEALGIDYEVVPGVSSFTAAAAALRRELTLPELSQTVILTRVAGRTPMPPTERLADLARHRATLVFFLSVLKLRTIVETLVPHYGADCPAAVVARASWPDERIVVGTLADIRERTAEARITSHAVVLVGRVLGATDFACSRLYAPDFAHRHRRARAAGGAAGGDGEPAKG